MTLRLASRCSALLLAHALLAPAANAQSVAERIGLLKAPGSTDWSQGVHDLLVSAYDRDGTSELDTEADVAAIPCDVWRTLEERHPSVLEIYGFAPDYLWVGDAFGFAEPVRQAAYDAGYACIEGSARPPSEPLSEAAATLRSLPGGDFYGEWDGKAAAVLLSHFDADRSRSIDADEVGALPCDVWTAIQDVYHRQYGGDFWVGAGFPADLGWNAETLGFDETAREPGYEAIQRCYGAMDTFGNPTAPSTPAPPAGSTAANSAYVRERLDYINEQFRLYNSYGTSWAVDEAARTWSVTDGFGTVTGDLATSEVRLNEWNNVGLFCTTGGTCLRGYNGPESSYTMGLESNGAPVRHLDTVIQQFQEIRSYVVGQ